MLGRAEGSEGQASSEDVAEAAKLGLSIKQGARVLHLIKYEPFEVGSRRYVEKKIKLVVPTSTVRRHQARIKQQD